MATSNLRFRIIGEDDASGTFLKVAASAKLLNSTFSDLGTNALGLTKLIGGAGLVPVLAGASAAAVELTTSLAAGAGALGIFGLSVAGIGKDMVNAQTKITALDTKLGTLTKGTKDYRTTLAELHDQQDAFNKQFGPAAAGLADMSSAWDRFKTATSSVTTGVMAKAFTLVKSVLPQLVPVSNAAGTAVGNLITELTVWTRSPEFGRILDWFQKSGPKAITAFGHAIGSLVHGLGSLLSNFAGPGDKAAKTLARLSKSFDKWAGSKGVSDSVDGFLKYVSNNGPQISSVFSSLADVLPKLAIALGQLGALNLSAIAMFLNLVANMPQGAFNVIVTGMFGMVAAAKALAIIQGISALVTGLSTAMLALNDACIATRAGLILIAIADGAVAIAAGVAAGATVALDAALAVLTSPITLVIAGLVALAAGLVYAYKHSETFRNIVNGAFEVIKVAGKQMGRELKTAFDAIVGAIHVVGKVAAWLWNNAFEPTIKFILHGLGMLLDVWAKMLDALSHVPGFGWAKTAAAAMQNAADKANAIANAIHNIPPTKTITLFIKTIAKGTPSAFTHSASGGGGGGSGGSGGGFDKVLVSPGEQLVRGLIEGIKRGYVPLATALAKINDYVQAQRDKLKALISDRNSFAAGFQSFSTSIFGADFGQDAAGNAVAPTATSIIAMQQQQAAQAKALRANVRKLVHMGLSPALLKQLQAGGQAGIAEINALAGASSGQIHQLNAANRMTQGALNSAGMAAGNAIFGDQIVQTRNNEDLAERIAKKWAHRMHEAGKNERLVITDANGQWLIKAIRKDKRTHGQDSSV